MGNRSINYTFSLHKALDVEALETDGLELDVVEQMRGMALKENEAEEPDVNKASSVFEKGCVSTKASNFVHTYFSLTHHP